MEQGACAQDDQHATSQHVPARPGEVRSSGSQPRNPELNGREGDWAAREKRPRDGRPARTSRELVPELRTLDSVASSGT
jgi:hypothetical protein